MPNKVEMLIIDPQVSFCDPSGELYVKGAEEDMSRLSKMIDRLSSQISNIHVTLDSHHTYDVAHPVFWRDSTGKNPEPFTIITAKDVETGVWFPSVCGLSQRMLSYVRKLEHNNKYPLCIWPPHALIGSRGHAVMPELFDSLKKWEEKNKNIVNYVSKGSNPYTEHYGIFMADVTQLDDPSTFINIKLLDVLRYVEVLIIAGEAGSHCVKFSVEQLIENIGDDFYAKKIVILTDAISPVTGFEKAQIEFYEEMSKLGATMSTTVDFLA